MHAITHLSAPIRLLLCIAFLLTFGITQSSAQEAYGERVMFVEFVDLNPDEYAKITHSLEGNENMQVKHACVPIGIVMFTLPEGNTLNLEQNFLQLQGLLVNTTNLQEMKILAQYSEEAFLARCRQFRGGNAQ